MASVRTNRLQEKMEGLLDFLVAAAAQFSRNNFSNKDEVKLIMKRKIPAYRRSLLSKNGIRFEERQGYAGRFRCREARKRADRVARTLEGDKEEVRYGCRKAWMQGIFPSKNRKRIRNGNGWQTNR